MKFDIFLVCCDKDYNKIPYVLNSINENIKGFEGIWLCTPSKLTTQELLDYNILKYKVHLTTDREVLKTQPYRWKYRSNWIYQQFLKLFQNVTTNDYYFVVDCDTIINKPMELFESNKPIWRYGWEQNNPPYYKFNKVMFDFERECGHTWLCDMGFYNKNYTIRNNGILKYYGYTIETFLEKTYQIINKMVYPSEADIYMGYIYKHYPDAYVYKHIKNKCDAKEHKNPLDKVWENNEIEDHIYKMKNTDYDIISIHSWCDNSHNKWR